MDINKLTYSLEVPYLLRQRTWPSDAAKLGLPVAPGSQLCPGWLTIFVNRFIIFKIGGELCPALFVIRCSKFAGDRPAAVAGNFFCGFRRLLAPRYACGVKREPPLGFTQASETNRKSEGSLLESKLFPWIFTARSTLYQVLLSASTSLSCRSREDLYCLLKSKKLRKKLSICKT